MKNLNQNKNQETNNQNNSSVHQSVLLSESLEGLNLKKNGSYLDVTLGGGGHSRAILKTDPSIFLVGLDWDQKVMDREIPKFEEEFGDRAFLAWGNFAHLYKLSKKYQFPTFDGILADFGTSKDQIFKTPGFSFASKSFLDMRMSKNHNKITAAEILNESSADELAYIFSEYGEERSAFKIAKKIVEVRKIKHVTHTNELVDIIISIKGPKIPNKIHPATKVFQALRIAVNHEIDNIKIFLKAAIPMLNKQGRLCCISFHSLEDRAVKDFFKEQEAMNTIKIITKKPIEPTEEEVKNNPSSRSAKLRIIEKI